MSTPCQRPLGAQLPDSNSRPPATVRQPRPEPHKRSHIPRGEQRFGGLWSSPVPVDRSPGIDPKYAHSVFEMFTRLHGRNESGSGIGLALCKRIVELHNGNIWAEPAESGGSRFRFTLADRVSGDNHGPPLTDAIPLTRDERAAVVAE